MDFHVKFHLSKEKSDFILNLLFKFCKIKFTNADFYLSFFSVSSVLQQGILAV